MSKNWNKERKEYYWHKEK